MAEKNRFKPCYNLLCPKSDSSEESGCKSFSIHTTDMCHSFRGPGEYVELKNMDLGLGSHGLLVDIVAYDSFDREYLVFFRVHMNGCGTIDFKVCHDPEDGARYVDDQDVIDRYYEILEA